MERIGQRLDNASHCYTTKETFYTIAGGTMITIKEQADINETNRVENLGEIC